MSAVRCWWAPSSVCRSAKLGAVREPGAFAGHVSFARRDVYKEPSPPRLGCHLFPQIPHLFPQIPHLCSQLLKCSKECCRSYMSAVLPAKSSKSRRHIYMFSVLCSLIYTYITTLGHFCFCSKMWSLSSTCSNIQIAVHRGHVCFSGPLSVRRLRGQS